MTLCCVNWRLIKLSERRILSYFWFWLCLGISWNCWKLSVSLALRIFPNLFVGWNRTCMEYWNRLVGWLIELLHFSVNQKIFKWPTGRGCLQSLTSLTWQIPWWSCTSSSERNVEEAYSKGWKQTAQLFEHVWYCQLIGSNVYLYLI